MKVQIHDTWVSGSKGQIHFDVALEDKKENNNDVAVKSAKKYLVSIGEEKATITSKECSFCHVQGCEENTEKEIKQNGYSIIKMSG